MPSVGVKPGTKTYEIRQRLEAGDPLDVHTVVKEYGVDRSLFSALVQDLKRTHTVTETRLGNSATVYKFGRRKPAKAAARKRQTSKRKAAPKQPAETRSPFEIVTDRLLAGEHLSAPDVSALGLKPQILSISVARLKGKGYLFDYTPEPDGKRWFVTGKGEPKPRRRPGSTNGSKPRMPAPELDAPTEVVLVHRLSDDDIDVAISQGGRQWLLQVKSCMEG